MNNIDTRKTSSLVLRQTLEKTIGGYWDGGLKRVFTWHIDREYADGKSRVGSWEANHYFEVKTGKSDRATLSNAKRHLQTGEKRSGIAMTFEYIEE